MHPCIKLLIQSCSCVVCARAHLSNRCIIQMASGRSKLAVWGYMAIGSWFIKIKTEVNQADHSIHSFESSHSPKIAVAWFDKIFSLGKIFKRQFDRIINGQESDNRLMLLQDVSSIALFPSYLIMLSTHVVYEAFCSDDFGKPLVYAEYISSIVLTGLLLLRLMIYMLGIEKAAENLLLLYESRKDFMVVIVFSLLPHFSVSLALALKDRYRRDTAEENFHNRTDNSSFAVNQTTHGSKQQATNEFASRISGFLAAILDPTFERAGLLESPGEMNWEDVVLAVVRVIGMIIVPFALHNIILATMMSKRGEQYQAHASGMWKLARAMIIMSIDEEIVTHKNVEQAVSRKDDDVYFQQGPGSNDDDNDNDDAWLVDLTLRYKVGSDSYMEYMGIPTQVNEYLCACLCALVSLRQLARTPSTIVIVYCVYTSSTHQPHAYAQTQTRRWICRPI